jgi:monoamine oxidase
VGLLQAPEGVAVAAGSEAVEGTLVQGTVVVLAPPPRLASAAQTCPHLKVMALAFARLL